MHDCKFIITMYANVSNLDTLGITKKEEVKNIEMWGKYISVGRGEFYASKQANVKVSKAIRVRYIDYMEIEDINYDDITVLDIEKNKKYTLVREYQNADNEFVTLYLDDIKQSR